MSERMSDQHQRQISRVIAESEQPVDPSKEEGVTPDLHGSPDRTRMFRTTNFSRMRTQWGPEDAIRLQELNRLSDQLLEQHFAVAIDLRNRVLLCVRVPKRDPATGELIPGVRGEPQWECHPNGMPAEDWTLLGDRQRDQFIAEITMHVYEWEQEAVSLWAESMYSKVEWEQAFASGYLGPDGKLTIDDRTQRGHNSSAEQRYFAVYRAMLSKKADALVWSMKALSAMLEKTRR